MMFVIRNLSTSNQHYQSIFQVHSSKTDQNSSPRVLGYTQMHPKCSKTMHLTASTATKNWTVQVHETKTFLQP